MSLLIRKCMHAIDGVEKYSYFRTDLPDTAKHRKIDPLDILYSRHKRKWEKPILLIMNQNNVPLPKDAEEMIMGMAKNEDHNAIERWKVWLEPAQSQRLIANYNLGKEQRKHRGHQWTQQQMQLTTR